MRPGPQSFFKNPTNAPYGNTMNQTQADIRPHCATITNKRPLAELDAYHQPSYDDDVLKAIERRPVDTKPDFGQGAEIHTDRF